MSAICVAKYDVSGAVDSCVNVAKTQSSFMPAQNNAKRETF